MIFHNNWQDSQLKGMAGDFGVLPATFDGLDIVFADYTCRSYTGEARVYYRKDGIWFEVHGSHCSCYGLEGQWEPEQTTKEALLMQPGLPSEVRDALA